MSEEEVPEGLAHEGPQGFSMTPAWVVKAAFKDVWLYDWLRARYGGLDGIWPGIDTIAEEFNVSRSTVERTIRRLVAAKCMEIVPRFRPDGSQTTNKYVTKYDPPRTS